MAPLPILAAITPPVGRSLLFDWPFVGLAVALASLIYLLWETRGATTSRWRAPAFVLPLLAPMYLLHQFEEHGVDAFGERYAFLGSLCGVLGYPDGQGCPADPAFIAAVNVGACGIAFVLAFAFRRTRPLVAACAWGVPLVNAVTHLGSGLVHRAYNPGLVTSAVLFVPLGLSMLHTVTASGVIRRRDVARIVATGVVMHLVLMGSLLAREQGAPAAIVLVVNVANGLWPIVFGTVGVPRSAVSTPATQLESVGGRRG